MEQLGQRQLSEEGALGLSTEEQGGAVLANICDQEHQRPGEQEMPKSSL